MELTEEKKTIIEAAKAHLRKTATFQADENFEANKAELIAKIEANDPETLVDALNRFCRTVSGDERKAVIRLSDEIANSL